MKIFIHTTLKVRYFGFVILGFCFCLNTSNYSAQDPGFTQFYSNKLYLNPAFAGTEKCPQIVSSYRNQWPNLSGNYVTQTVSYSKHSKDLSGGIGFQFLNDNAGSGTLKTNMLSATYSYLKEINKDFNLSIGIEGAYHQKDLDWSNLNFNDMIDDRLGFIYETQEEKRGGTASFVDFSAGAIVYTDQVFVGLAVHHLNTPNNSFIYEESFLDRKITLHAGAKLFLDKRKPKDNYISTNILFQKQGPHEHLNLGIAANLKALSVGVWHRLNESMIGSVGLKTDHFKIVYSYDYVTSGLAQSVGVGSHEISTTISLKCKKKRPRYKAVPCPTL